jgi:hypothetical protein
MKLKALFVAGLLALVALPLAGFALAGPQEDGIQAARQATIAFRDLEAAADAGYTLELPDVQGDTCIVDLAAEPRGAMGVHYVNLDLVGDAELDVARPEVLVYEPEKNGNRKLVAVEYVVFQDAWDTANEATGGAHAPAPELFGVDFEFSDGSRYGLPAFWALHAWIWRPNKDPLRGMFASWNQKVDC